MIEFALKILAGLVLLTLVVSLLSALALPLYKATDIIDKRLESINNQRTSRASLWDY